jgi:hypothetical protein
MASCQNDSTIFNHRDIHLNGFDSLRILIYKQTAKYCQMFHAETIGRDHKIRSLEVSCSFCKKQKKDSSFIGWVEFLSPSVAIIVLSGQAMLERVTF